MNKLLEIRKLSHQAQALSEALIALYYERGGKPLYTLVVKSIRRASRRMDKWEAMMKK